MTAYSHSATVRTVLYITFISINNYLSHLVDAVQQQSHLLLENGVYAIVSEYASISKMVPMYVSGVASSKWMVPE